MGLDVGVVTIEYLERPGQPMYGFLQELALNPYTGMGDAPYIDESIWGGGWEGNAIYEYQRASLTKIANRWADQNSLAEDDRASLLNWLDNLPGQSDYVMLHLGN